MIRPSGCFLSVLAIVALAIMVRSALVYDSITVQTRGPFCVQCASLAGMAEVSLFFCHHRWIDYGRFASEDEKLRAVHFDHGLMYNCVLRTDAIIAGTDFWKAAQSRRDAFDLQFLRFAIQARSGPVRLIRFFIPDWMIAALLGSSGALLLVRARQQPRERSAAGAVPCSSCGYDLRGTPAAGGLSSRQCSECGAITPSVERPRKRQKQR